MPAFDVVDGACSWHRGAIGWLIGDSEEAAISRIAANDANGTSRHFAAPQNLSAIGRWSQPVDATPEGQLAINAYDGLPNARPIVFGNSPRNQLSHNTIFSAAPCQHEVTDLSSYTLYLFPLR